jgi:hypothetical protein
MFLIRYLYSALLSTRISNQLYYTHHGVRVPYYHFLSIFSINNYFGFT